MKREDLVKLGITEELVDQVMTLHGKSVQKHQNDLAASAAEVDTLKKQLGEANSAIEGFRKLDVDGIKAAADEWKAKAEQAAKDAEAQIQALKFDHALDGALGAAKAKNAKAVKALLQAEALKLNEADGSILGLKEQLEKIKSENDYLFESDEKTPTIVTGGKSKSVLADPMVLAARKAAGLSIE